MTRRSSDPAGPAFLPRGVFALPFTTPGGTRLMVAVTAAGTLAAEPVRYTTFQAGNAATRKLWRTLDKVDPRPPRGPERRRGARERRREQPTARLVDRSTRRFPPHNGRRSSGARCAVTNNHAHAVALHFMHYNFCRAHTTLTDHVWTVEDVCALLDPTAPLV
jgi:hypothetical protein